MTTARRCTGCGAALGDPTDDDLSIVCRFCGLRHDLNDFGGAPAQVVVQMSPTVRRANATMVLIMFAFVMALVGFGLYTSYKTATAVTTRVQEATTAVQQRMAEAKRPLALTELSGYTGGGWKDVDITPPPGGFASFEPVAALPWAFGIARAWASDAELTRIDVGRVTATGVVDLDGEASSGYRFTSPARALQAKQELDAGSKVTTTNEMMIQIRGTAVRVLLGDDRRREPKAAPPVSLPLPEILERARRSKGFRDRPFYAGYMIHLPREGWVWYFTSPSGDGFPRVRARDGRRYPY